MFTTFFVFDIESTCYSIFWVLINPLHTGSVYIVTCSLPLIVRSNEETFLLHSPWIMKRMLQNSREILKKYFGGSSQVLSMFFYKVNRGLLIVDASVTKKNGLQYMLTVEWHWKLIVTWNILIKCVISIYGPQ